MFKESFGNTAAYYRYDPYGKVIEASGSHANINPLRYRGYYYDVETELYYLQSRYYDPQVCRFINADALVSTGQGLLGNNMFAYCLNNPICYTDPSGNVALDAFYAFAYEAGYSTKKTVDITEKLNNAMVENRETLCDYAEENGYLDAVDFFIEKVGPGGEWDFKSQDDWNLDPNVTYVYGEKELRFDDIGNIHYGYVGSALFPLPMLLMAGGVVQIYTNTSSWEYWYCWFDEPRDQDSIRYGYNLWKFGVID